MQIDDLLRRMDTIENNILNLEMEIERMKVDYDYKIRQLEYYKADAK